MSRWLFFDDRYFNVINGFERTMVKASQAGNLCYVDPATNHVSLAWGYPLVRYNELLKRYVMYYQGWSIDRTIIDKSLLLAAVSKDGVSFEPLDMRPYTAEEPILMNQVLPYRLGNWIFAEGQFFHLPSFGKTPYVALCIYKNETNGYLAATFVSEDGLHFRHEPDMAWHQGEDAPDVLISVFFDETNKLYRIYRRPSHTDRRIALSITRDFKTYTEPEIVVQPDCLDKPLTDFYGLSILHSGENILGFLMVYETPNYLRFGLERASGLPGHKFFGGVVQPQLVYSDDGKHFNRFFRSSILQSNEDSFPCIYPTGILQESNRWLIYASVTSEEHGYTSPGKGRIAAYQIRPDGFCAMVTTSGYGELTTKQWLYEGGDLEFNLACPDGTASIQIADSDNVPIPGLTYDECIPFQGDSLHHVFAFRHADMYHLSGKVLVLGIRGRNLALYSISGSITKVTPYQAMKHVGR